MAINLTGYAKAGYESWGAKPSPSNPHLWSSSAHIAWCVGRWLAETGRSAPRSCCMSRGYSVRVNDMLVKWESGAPGVSRIERIS